MLLQHTMGKTIEWIETSNLTKDEKVFLNKNYDISLEELSYATDVYEQSSYMHDISQQNLVVFNVPIKLNQTNRYISQPIGFILLKKALITFNETNVSNDQLWSIPSMKEFGDPVQLMAECLNQVIDMFIPILRDLTKQRKQLDGILNKGITNQDLVKLSHLQQSLIFLEGASESNLSTLEHLLSSFTKNIAEDEHNQLKDLKIKAKQIQHMIDIESNIVAKISQVFDSIMNNNLNNKMEVLTIWSLAIAIPTLLTGFYGMNIKVPMVEVEFLWFFLVILSIILIIGLIQIFNKK